MLKSHVNYIKNLYLCKQCFLYVYIRQDRARNGSVLPQVLKYHPDTGGESTKFIELMENYKKLL